VIKHVGLIIYVCAPVIHHCPTIVLHNRPNIVLHRSRNWTFAWVDHLHI